MGTLPCGVNVEGHGGLITECGVLGVRTVLQNPLREDTTGVSSAGLAEKMLSVPVAEAGWCLEAF